MYLLHRVSETPAIKQYETSKKTFPQLHLNPENIPQKNFSLPGYKKPKGVRP